MLKLSLDAYSIYVGSGFDSLPHILCESINYLSEKIYIITDTNVEKYYLEEVKTLLLNNKFNLAGSYVIKAGEKSKNLDTVNSIYQDMTNKKLDRKSIILTLGGGVVGDIAGFCAATYMRGIRFVQIPTTLLSQVDSSIGGKVGVDFSGKKNLIGAFYQPKLVYINASTLQTLTDEQYRSGLGEVVKYGIIDDIKLFKFLKTNAYAVKNRDKGVLKDVIIECCKIKAKVVQQDEKETLGIREKLNFGHTVGHAVESTLKFTAPHGICVGAGSIAASYLALSKKLITKQEYEDIVKLILEFNIIPDNISSIDVDEVLETMKYDKKNTNGKVKFILPKKIGEVCIYDDLLYNNIKEAVCILKEENYFV